jgi:chromosomal replication initiation ATPase DnaA
MRSQATACTPVLALEAVRPKVVRPAAPGMLPEIRRLLDDVCGHFGVDPDVVRSKDRHKSVANARHVFWWVARNVWGYSYPELGRLLGPVAPFDHSTCMNGVARVADHEKRGTPLGRAARLLRGGDEVQLTENGAITGPTSSSESKERMGG